MDRSYKIYIADNSDRAKEIKKWQANISVPYVQSIVETLKPRILDARPEFVVQGRNEDDQMKASKVNDLLNYTWEIAKADATAEKLVSSALIYGMGYMQVYWKKDVRKMKFLNTKDLDKKKYSWDTREEVFYDAPYIEWVDNYSLWYDWHNVDEEKKQYWFKRLLLTEEEIRRRYNYIDKKKLDMALEGGTKDLTDYASIRLEVRKTHEKILKGADMRQGGGEATNRYEGYQNGKKTMHEVFEWLRPFEDDFCVMVNEVPVLKDGSMPNPYDFKETFFIGTPYLKIPGEYEGYGLPMILENPQVMLNLFKNQRLDSATLNIHKMWIVNPLANINKDDLVMRPFGIIYSPDPSGAREVQMSDIKPSAYREEELLKEDIRYAAGVDDFSMGGGGSASSATEVRHLRESTLERVRLFVNHLGESYSIALRYIVSMWSQFMTEEMVIRIIGEDGKEAFPVIEPDDLMGEFDFKATVIPALAGQNEVKKKQDMDLFQLLGQLEFIDQQKLVAKILFDWNWDFESIKKQEQEAPPMPEEMMGVQEPPIEEQLGGKKVSPEVVRDILGRLGESPESFEGLARQPGGYAEMASPVNLLEGGTPPTPKGAPNPRGLNRGGKVNTNIPTKGTSSPESSLLNRVANIQR